MPGLPLLRVGFRLALVPALFALACGPSDEGADADGGGSSGSSGSAGKGASGGSGTGGSGGSASGQGGSTSGSGGTPTGGAGGGGASGASAGTAGGAGGPTVCTANCRYVRSGATGANDGSRWDDAFTELPAMLVRGQTYFIAAGEYASYGFDDAEAGPTRIRVLRATSADHGDGAGWLDAYGAGEAVFGELDFETGAYDFDGRGATRAVGTFAGTVVRIGGDAVNFRGVDVDGALAMTGGEHTAGACTGMIVDGDDVTVARSRIHDIADDGVVVGGSTRFTFEENELDSLYGCGTDADCVGPCDNGHSDGIELYDVHDSRFAGNYAHDIASTSTFFFGNWADELGDGPSEYCENILLVNNVLYNPDTGFVIYLEDVRGVTLLHNTIWGQHQGAYGGLAVGVNVSGLTLVNNAILSVNYAHLGSSFDAAEHHGDYNLFGKSLGQWEDAPHDLVANDPGFAGLGNGDAPKVDGAVPADFAPETTSPLRSSGTSDAAYALPSVDFSGAPRGSPPTIGAFE